MLAVVREVGDAETLPETGVEGSHLALLGVLFSILGATALLLAPGRRGPGTTSFA